MRRADDAADHAGVTPDSVRVRMYRQGLGDCFLLTVTTAGVARHALVDFGLLKGTPDAATRMHALAADIRSVTGGHLDVVAATHEHWDHISGFVQAQDVLSGVTVGEVWLAWTEDPHDVQAQKLRAAHDRGVRALAGAAHALQLAGSARAEQLLAVLGFYGDVGSSGDVGLAGGATTAQAMHWLKQRPTVRYLRPSNLIEALGIRVYVLGPPTDTAWLRRSDPSVTPDEVYRDDARSDAAHADGFLAAAQALDGDGVASAAMSTVDLQPFDPFFRCEPDDVADDPLLGGVYLDPDEDWRRIDHDWLGAADVLALNLDSNTNNTSLVLAFELGNGDVLLFPGDAQVGNWLSWQTVTWTTPTAVVTAPELLARTRLYKVGHHGSHNATLRAKGLELMTSPDLVAMLPVNRVTAKMHAWNMPLRSLLDALETKTEGRVIDAELGVPATRPQASTTVARWTDFLAHTDVQEFWVDHTIEWAPVRH